MSTQHGPAITSMFGRRRSHTRNATPGPSARPLPGAPNNPGMDTSSIPEHYVLPEIDPGPREFGSYNSEVHAVPGAGISEASDRVPEAMSQRNDSGLAQAGHPPLPADETSSAQHLAVPVVSDPHSVPLVSPRRQLLTEVDELQTRLDVLIAQATAAQEQAYEEDIATLARQRDEHLRSQGDDARRAAEALHNVEEEKTLADILRLQTNRLELEVRRLRDTHRVALAERDKARNQLDETQREVRRASNSRDVEVDAWHRNVAAWQGLWNDAARQTVERQKELGSMQLAEILAIVEERSAKRQIDWMAETLGKISRGEWVGDGEQLYRRWMKEELTSIEAETVAASTEATRMSIQVQDAQGELPQMQARRDAARARGTNFQLQRDRLRVAVLLAGTGSASTTFMQAPLAAYDEQRGADVPGAFENSRDEQAAAAESDQWDDIPFPSPISSHTPEFLASGIETSDSGSYGSGMFRYSPPPASPSAYGLSEVYSTAESRPDSMSVDGTRSSSAWYGIHSDASGHHLSNAFAAALQGSGNTSELDRTEDTRRENYKADFEHA
ncbi:hypothetical protein PLICRDRAFT_176706 [Plicaturopsis crispa FD-325 SS-3]|nr:hypothetical protein PLICRDRAFT_176706 [Plicaturopsis crispa FD-325 SS-3]